VAKAWRQCGNVAHQQSKRENNLEESVSQRRKQWQYRRQISTIISVVMSQCRRKYPVTNERNVSICHPSMKIMAAVMAASAIMA
jgi:hypothetical protein